MIDNNFLLNMSEYVKDINNWHNNDLYKLLTILKNSQPIRCKNCGELRGVEAYYSNRKNICKVCISKEYKTKSLNKLENKNIEDIKRLDMYLHRFTLIKDIKPYRFKELVFKHLNIQLILLGWKQKDKFRNNLVYKPYALCMYDKYISSIIKKVIENNDELEVKQTYKGLEKLCEKMMTYKTNEDYTEYWAYIKHTKNKNATDEPLEVVDATKKPKKAKKKKKASRERITRFINEVENVKTKRIEMNKYLYENLGFTFTNKTEFRKKLNKIDGDKIEEVAMYVWQNFDDDDNED